MRHRLQWFIQLRAHGLSKGNEPTLLTGHDTPCLYLYILTIGLVKYVK